MLRRGKENDRYRWSVYYVSAYGRNVRFAITYAVQRVNKKPKNATLKSAGDAHPPEGREPPPTAADAINENPLRK